MEIPYKDLSDDALQAIIEEFITREGTEYGAHEYSLQQKIEQIKAQLQLGKIVINYDVDSQSCHLQSKLS
ncbi:MAG: YheU family protein [Pseudohongiella sp.]|jgi:uncharacterized protein|nr:YheU family protein [Pseudohongiella sp.]